MAVMQWNANLSVGVAVIDNQHQRLLAQINELSEAMKQGKGKEVLGKTLTNLISYTVTHFQTEEKYFDLFRYPEASIHKREHVAFVKKVSDFKEGFEKGKLSVTIELMDFLSDWLKDHIQGTDKKYSQFFNAKGLK
jgi:hemerythrin